MNEIGFDGYVYVKGSWQFKNCTFTTAINKFIIGLISQFVCYQWLQQNQIYSKYIILWQTIS